MARARPALPHRSFRLFLHTKLSNPHYPPEIQAETTLINFTVTEQVRGRAGVCAPRAYAHAQGGAGLGAD